MRVVARYHPSMADYIVEFCLCGMSGNAELAEQIAHGYSMPVTADLVQRWRNQHRRFDRACVASLVQLQAVAMGQISQAIYEGDVATSKWLMERTNAAFKPSSKLEHGGRIEGLGDMLARRVSEDELRKQGVLVDDED
jgi:hypothetical protein